MMDIVVYAKDLRHIKPHGRRYCTSQEACDVCISQYYLVLEYEYRGTTYSIVADTSESWSVR